jgi:hypothetical protein
MVLFVIYGMYSRQFKHFAVGHWLDEERNLERFEEEYLYLHDFGPKLQ